MAAPQQLPYGLADYSAIRAKHMAYVDKTHFIAELEKIGSFLFFLRPRRFGKSLLVNQLWCYYDLRFSEDFENWFSGTRIGDHPTSLKNSYLVLHFNFAEVDPDPKNVRASFERYTKIRFLSFLESYALFMDEKITRQITEAETAGNRLSALFTYAARKKLKVYVLIDEYDNFTNTILSLKEDGKRAYQDLTHDTEFFRHFFNVLKGGTTEPNSGLARLFVTGVSPVTMDDVTSGYNIGRQISLNKRLDEIAGFTRAEVRDLIASQNVPAVLGTGIDDVLAVMEEWYGGYRFTESTRTSLFNPDMVLYFINEVIDNERMPTDMIDHNVRIDYSKLHHLIVVDNRLNGNFSRLSQVLESGYLLSSIHTGFPLEELIEEQNFISLLYYFGLVSLRDRQEGMSRLEIPNRTVAQLMYGYLRKAFVETEVFETKLAEMASAVRKMAFRGEWQGFFEHLAVAVKEQTSIRDYLSGEKVIQGFLLAYLSVTDFFLARSEHELNQGFCDLYLEPFRAKYPDIAYGYLIELKYIKRGERKEEALSKRIEKKIAEARDQLAGYVGDERLKKVGRGITWLCPILVFHGWELVARDLYETSRAL